MVMDRKYRRTRITVRFDKAHGPSRGIPHELYRKLSGPGATIKFVAAGLRAVGVTTGRLSHFWRGLEALESKPRKTAKRRAKK